VTKERFNNDGGVFLAQGMSKLEAN